MKFIETKLKGAYIIEIEPIEDERGFFARSFCVNEFAKFNLCTKYVQNNLSFNKSKGTLRGMHYQKAPYEEIKLVSCIQGAIYDVIIDLRADSPTRNQWIAVDLNAQNYKLLYIPKGFAHGFQTLIENTVVQYFMSEFYHPEAAQGIRWNDSYFMIEWPILDPIISNKDNNYSLFKVV